ncbi:MAG TPA: class I SAM-dependent methyltransferase [Segeticoccus sp.]|uniref:class I SAM-dependent methyltransferase n=1 Tax=Segeticoccus sp. TaxID=2706531 RepID=UPI002D80E5B6|nr:class I SAM-dependent methyltransferase [Segeticoccus sp.]HET8598968.1 class I SAM-dependent methyltransferase [Segeticoccus sp.]
MDANTWNERYAEHDLVWGAAPNRWVEQETSQLPPGRAIDLACGEGRNAIWLAARGWRVQGVDFSETGLARAAKLAEQHRQESGEPLEVTWAVADVTTLELPEDAFDLVLVCYLHLVEPQRRGVMQSAAGGLAPGGTLLVIGHDSSNLKEGYGGPQDASVLFTAEDVERDLATPLDAGRLVVDRSERVAREVQTEEGRRTAWDVLFRAHRAG